MRARLGYSILFPRNTIHCPSNDSLTLSHIIANIVGNGENAGYQHFILFPNAGYQQFLIFPPNFLSYPKQISISKSHLFCRLQKLSI